MRDSAFCLFLPFTFILSHFLHILPSEEKSRGEEEKGKIRAKERREDKTGEKRKRESKEERKMRRE